MQLVKCIGSPLELGLQHGQQAADKVKGSIAFYTSYFLQTSNLAWGACEQTALKWLPWLEEMVPDLVEEMRGVAAGASLPFASVLALNMRTEIAFGLFSSPTSDGCTALTHHSSRWTSDRLLPATAFLAQNWDWQPAQAPNLIQLHLRPIPAGGSTRHETDDRHVFAAYHPTRIAMITEAGIIGKIGLNSAGLGTCLNALRARGVAYDRLPVHLALRAALQCETVDEASERLTKLGVASAAHILFADAERATGLECNALGTKAVRARRVKQGKVDGKGRLEAMVLVHTNHFVEPCEGLDDLGVWKDSPARLERMRSLIETQLDRMSSEIIASALEDEVGFPGSINRKAVQGETSQTLFSIVMDLLRKEARVKVGRPSEEGETIILKL